ncbi:hypothetical protein EWB00_000039, partial [Schistosoma japonicum]
VEANTYLCPLPGEARPLLLPRKKKRKNTSASRIEACLQDPFNSGQNLALTES